MFRQIRSLVVPVAAALAIIGASGARGNEEKIPWKLDVITAARIAALAIGDGTKPENLDYGGFDAPASTPPVGDPPFFGFYGVNPSPGRGSFGYFAVNPWTGDVWALWDCNKITSPGSRKIQAQIRKRFTVEELKQYARLSAFKPECIAGDE